MKQHHYELQVTWTGNNGAGTSTYTSYRRDHVVESAGKARIDGSSDPAFRGDPKRYNPEELLLAALSACHMLAYLHLCAVNHVTVAGYRDNASGVMEESPDGSGRFVRALLKPVVEISPGSDRKKALELHHDAHRLCFIANSVNFPVECAAEIVETSTAGTNLPTPGHSNAAPR